MAVPSGNNHLKNTAGGAFTSQTQGGTLLGNGTTGDVITKALLLKDAVDAETKVPLPIENSYPAGGGVYGTQKAYTSGTFAYFSEGNYVIRGVSATLSGVASTEVLIPGSDNGGRNAIHQFIHDFGVGLLAKWRANEFSWIGRFDNGNVITRRVNWKDSNGTAVGIPATLTGNDPWDPVAGSASQKTDSAANPTRAIPGELVMKVDFVDLAVATGGDYYNYSAITGM